MRLTWFYVGRTHVLHRFALDLDVHSDETATVGINVAEVLDGRLI